MSLSSQFHLLLVEDDPLVIESMKMILPTHWRMTAVSNPQLLDSKMMVHAAFVDMHLKGASQPAEGPDVIAKLSKMNPRLDIVAISGDLDLELMEKCLKNGAQKYLAKPLMTDEVLSTLEKIESLWFLRKLESQGGHNQVRWIGTSLPSDQVKKSIASFRGEPGPILIEGETGTGKEVAFRLLNQQEPSRPFVAVNVAAISENLFESEMFGHVKGAFTGADQQKIGLAEAAHGGDLFLDEIEALSMNNQVKLLRFLETGELRKVGGKDTSMIKARVILATNQNLEQLVKDGKFREDLLFRISGKKLRLPPLRDRSEDLAELAAFFLSAQKPRINKSFASDALDALKSYTWPGNVREFKRICEQLAIKAPLPLIRREDVEQILAQSGASSQKFELSKGLAILTEEFEARVIQMALSQSSDVDTAADLLKISRSSLYKKMKDYQLGSS